MKPRIKRKEKVGLDLQARRNKMECISCTHQSICKYKSTYKKAVEQINKLDIVDDENNEAPIEVEINCNKYRSFNSLIDDLEPDTYKDLVSYIHIW